MAQKYISQGYISQILVKYRQFQLEFVKHSQKHIDEFLLNSMDIFME